MISNLKSSKRITTPIKISKFQLPQATTNTTLSTTTPVLHTCTFESSACSKRFSNKHSCTISDKVNTKPNNALSIPGTVQQISIINAFNYEHANIMKATKTTSITKHNEKHSNKNTAKNDTNSNSTTVLISSSKDNAIAPQTQPRASSHTTTLKLAATLPSKEEKGEHTFQNLLQLWFKSF